MNELKAHARRSQVNRVVASLESAGADAGLSHLKGNDVSKSHEKG